MKSQLPTIMLCNFHARGLLRTVPREKLVHVFILAALIHDDLQVAWGNNTILWARTMTNDFERPRPLFPPTKEHLYSLKGGLLRTWQGDAL